MAPAIPTQEAPLPPAPVKKFYLSTPDSIQPASPRSFPHSIPVTSLVLSLSHPDPSTSPATAFFLSCLPDPILYLHYAATYIHPRLSLGNGSGWRHQLVELVLEDKDGLAATSGGRIAVSLKWVRNIMDEVRKGQKRVEMAIKEFKGVLLHEMVHTIQHDGQGSAPGWLVESIADVCRLYAGLDPPHWRKPGQGKKEKGWEDGYDAGARFLAWLVEDDGGIGDGSGKNRREEHIIIPSQSSASSAPFAQATKYPTFSHTYQQPFRPVLPSKPRLGPFPDLLRLIDSRLIYEKWNDSWWEEMTGHSLDKLWDAYLTYYGEK
ncbi:hypothetical protein CNAG_04889 [Cryptococcus neoformans var. grubii H99]|uniref:BSP-domain-containing protein n=1 Tax=Cryptococcus neoformans (strain H99 / ATCC 208821 / CBS 10515 / FGSC 9487) TaxID=235443 RepID=J9VS85_CRYN9|nr:hypothetical protein CNAG_04889 [Cryptococcus neoformans var. grubii H99]AFR97327.1 hypothetical protein CNAG_04889 [Cryptococcus neoformans var. grubii H99]AUB27336.1 hypothetical protein CKF44_04889 [Cryptococcus neoformans var. grubii]|eukprot:XP_012052275.1 hypothetical protein CNAG_04889 [Cryptococcus neoformans var. grubii H99]